MNRMECQERMSESRELSYTKLTSRSESQNESATHKKRKTMKEEKTAGKNAEETAQIRNESGEDEMR